MTQQTDVIDAELAPAWKDDASSGLVGIVIADTYRITELIGSGGSGDVFRVEHLRLGKAFALKLLREDSARLRHAGRRFRREARVIASLQSEHIVSVVDCGELPGGRPFLVMELLQGRDLRSLLRQEGRLPCRRALHLILDAARGLTAVHAAGLVHRDLKPENLFVTRRTSGEDCCKILDFGVAKVDATSSTLAGSVLGTIRYMAPEQLQDSSQAGPASDVYALGAIAYECLSGARAHTGDTVQDVMFSVMNRAPRPLGALRPDLPDSVVSLVTRCLEKDAAARFASSSELVEGLSVALALAPEAHESTLADQTWVRARPLPAGRKWLGGLGWLLALCLAGLLVLSTTSRPIPPPPAAVPAKLAPPLPAPTQPPAAEEARPPAPAAANLSAALLPAAAAPDLPEAERVRPGGSPSKRPGTATSRAPLRPPNAPALPSTAPESVAPPSAASRLDPTNPYEN